MKEIIIDGNDAILGRLGTYVAKELLKGNSVKILNSEEVIISGKKELFVEKIKQKRRMGSGGSLKGPKYIRESDRILKRIIRGMLPWDKPKGRQAYKRLKCFIGENKISEDKLKEIIKLEHNKPFNHTKLKEIVKSLK